MSIAQRDVSLRERECPAGVLVVGTAQLPQRQRDPGLHPDTRLWVLWTLGVVGVDGPVCPPQLLPSPVQQGDGAISAWKAILAQWAGRGGSMSRAPICTGASSVTATTGSFCLSPA